MKRLIVAGIVIVLVSWGGAAGLAAAITRNDNHVADCFGKVYQEKVPALRQLIQDQKNNVLPKAPGTAPPPVPDPSTATSKELSDYHSAYNAYQQEFSAYQIAFASYDSKFRSLSARASDLQDQFLSSLEACST